MVMATVTVTDTDTDTSGGNSSAVINGYEECGTVGKEKTEKKSMRKEVINNGVVYFVDEKSSIV